MFSASSRAFRDGLFGVATEKPQSRYLRETYNEGRNFGKKHEGFFAMMAATTGLATALTSSCVCLTLAHFITVPRCHAMRCVALSCGP